MKARFTVLALVLTLALCGLAACSSSSSGSAASGSASAASSEASASASAAAEALLADGLYTATFTTDSTMFHINEAYDNKVTLTVENGQITAHAVLAGVGYVNLYPGKMEDAQKDGAVLLEPIPEKVDFNDGTEPEDVYAFDIPVPVLDEPFDVATLGSKGKWYDHTVTISEVEPAQ